MPERNWNQRYVEGDLPWDTGEPDEHLVGYVDRAGASGRALVVGCGTGTNAVWLARQGFDVVGVDIAPTAIEQARARASHAGVKTRFEVLDFLHDDVPAGPYDLVFDRGCFHVFDEASDRDRFAAQVAGQLVEGGRWLSIIGSTEGPPRDTGPPRRTACEVTAAIEPHLAIESLAETPFDSTHHAEAMAWRCISRRREIPAVRSPG